LCAPATRIVSLTVTEKAYGIDRAGRCIDPAHTAVAADLAAPLHPTGVMGMIVEGLRRRKEHGLAPVTVLCCDNLSDNGDVVRAGVLDFSGRLHPQLRDWIEREVAFPSTMVDRITPPSTPETLAEAERLTGFRDLAAVQTEPFSHWVIEDRFVVGRPDWEAGGAIFASSVAPYEQMKLRMLNGAHSLMAYAGFLLGYRYIRDVVQDAFMVRLVRRYMQAARATLGPVPGIDLDEYAEALMQRFANPAIAHETKHIAMDGTEKLPQRSIACAAETLEHGGDLGPFAFAIAAWMRFCAGRTEAGVPYSLNDPRETTIAAKLASAGDDARSIVAALQTLPGMFPERLKADEKWCGLVADALSRMQRDGMAGAVAAELTREG
jgi:fructuronate reductase